MSIRSCIVTLAVLMASMTTMAAAAPSWAQDGSSPPDAAGLQSTALPEGFTQEMADEVDDIIRSATALRELPAAQDITFRIIDAETFRSELADLFAEEYPPEYVAAEDALLTRLGFLGPDEDLGQLILSLYESQVLAYYDPATRTFSLVGPLERIGPLESVVVAHEYDHAMQDAQWDLKGSRITDLTRGDEILAQQALTEGDATALMYDWAARNLGLRQLLGVAGQALTKQDEKTLKRIPPLLRRQLEFPYLDGFAFVNALRGRSDWSGVDQAWEQRPVSTEQILHPENYPGQTPIDFELPDVAGRLGSGWSSSYEQTLGEMQIGVWVADGRTGSSPFPKLPNQLPDADAAAGWGGDRLVSLDGPDGAWAVVWQTAWDSPTDADEFDKAARKVVKDLAGVQSISGDDVTGGLSSPVLVLVADSGGTLSAVQSALDLGS